MKDEKRVTSNRVLYYRVRIANNAAGGKQQSSKQALEAHRTAMDCDINTYIITVELNDKFVDAVQSPKTYKLNALLPYPLNPDLWLWRAIVSGEQAIVLFPAFNTYYIGFQVEKNWNTNLPYTYPAEEIFAHISHNKGDYSIPDEYCIQAIQLLQSFIKIFLQIDRLHPENLQEVALLLLPIWEELDCHNVTQAISGALAKAGYASEQVENLFRSIYCDESDIDLNRWLAVVALTFERVEQGKNILGLEALSKERLLSTKTFKRLKELLSRKP